MAAPRFNDKDKGSMVAAALPRRYRGSAPRAYRSARDHVDDVVALARALFERRALAAAGEPQRLGVLDFEIAKRGEDIEDSLAAARARGLELPLDRIGAAFQLHAAELRCVYLLLALAIAAEVRELAGSPDGTGTIEQLGELVHAAPEVRDRFAEHLGPDGRLLAYGLVEYAGGGRGRFARPLRLADRIVELAYGLDRPDLGAFATLVNPAASDLIVPEDARAAVCGALRRHVEAGRGPVPVLRGARGSGRRTLLASVARELGARLLVVRCGELPWHRLGPALTAIAREAVLAHAVIVLADAEQLAGDQAGRPDRTPAVEAALAGFAGPLALTVGRGASTLLFARTRGAVVVELPPLSEAERAALWSRHVPAELAAGAAAKYRLTGGQIEGAAHAACARTREPTEADLHAGVCETVGDQLSALGVRIEWRPTWADLVLPADSLDELHQVVHRVRNRRRVLEDWGFGAKVPTGLGTTALFSGPPGTGKTMAAGLIAGDLGLDLYRIDLAQVVSSRPGEIDEHLAQVFGAAEIGHAILLFDEADVLLARRAELGSLVRRMEAFTGITILTSSLDPPFDEALRRRLAFRIRFPMPEAGERARLWRAMVPERARVAPDVDFARLAERFAMSGGYIRNAALRAAFLAAGESDHIHMHHLLEAAGAEYAWMRAC